MRKYIRLSDNQFVAILKKEKKDGIEEIKNKEEEIKNHKDEK